LRLGGIIGEESKGENKEGWLLKGLGHFGLFHQRRELKGHQSLRHLDFLFKRDRKRVIKIGRRIKLTSCIS